jgi:hypothetical protein
MNKKKKLIITILSTIILGMSCENLNQNNYKYFDGFSFYMKSVHNIDILTSNKEIIYYVMLVEGCEPCIAGNSAMLQKIKKNNNLCLILVGNIEESSDSATFLKLNNKMQVLKDPNYEIFSYETGISKPLLIHIKNGRCKHFLLVTDFEIENTYNYLNTDF